MKEFKSKELKWKKQENKYVSVVGYIWYRITENTNGSILISFCNNELIHGEENIERAITFCQEHFNKQFYEMIGE